MEIILAKSAGFCYGVANAVKKASELVQENQKLENKKVIKSLGPIIHNETIINELKESGLEVINSPCEASEGEKVVIRAHGVGEKVYQELSDRKAEVLDVTCPYVMKIHDLVREKSKEGYVIIVVGDAKHPEVKGICGWAEGPNWVVMNPEELENEEILNAYNESKGLCLVSQTTLTQEKWEKVLNFARFKFKNVLKFDTICKATVQRQSEAIELAKKVEAMVVIGSRTSSNTLKLEEVCKMFCERTYLVEGPNQLIPELFKYINKIGITAGASTPGKVIKEVIGKMSEMQSNPSTESFEELLEQYSGEVRSGRTTKGTVSNITTEKIYVDLGGKFEGEIPASQYEEGELPAIGEVIDVRVNRISEKDSAIHLSRSTDRFAKTAKRFTELMEAGEPVSAKVERAVRGGAIARTEAGEVFIPLPLLSDRYVEKADDFVGKQIMVKIVSVDEKRRSVKASAREYARAEKNKAEEVLWSKLEVGSIVPGTVKNFTDFRAFIDLGGIDGSIHVSEMSWNRIKHPSEVLNVGDKIEVKILDIDREKKRVSLQLKKEAENPWFGAEEKYAIGNVVEGKVARIVPFGAFIQLAPGVDGLVHISQISDFRLAKVEEVLKVDDVIEGKIIEVDIPSQKISISIREVAPINPPERVAEAEARLKEREVRESERVKKSEDRRTAFEEKAAKKAVFDAEKANYNAKKAEKAAAPKSHVEELTNTIGDLSALANMFKDDNADTDPDSDK